MADERVWIGFDLGATLTHVCVIADDGTTLHEQESETKADHLKNALASFPVDRIGLIAVESGADTYVVRRLRAEGFPIAIFEARKAHKFLTLRRNKTDASDARGLADLARLGRHTVSQVHLKTLECQQLRGLLVMRNRLVIMRVTAENALRSRLGMYGLRFKSSHRPGGARGQVEALIAELRGYEQIDIRPEVAPLVDLCESLRTTVGRLNWDLEKRARSYETCRLLMEVPGVGTICALSFYSAVEDPTRFERASDVGAYLGLAPRRYQSGEVSRTRGITKTGNKLTRAHLVNAAKVFGTRAPEGALKDWYVSLRARAGPKRANVALARKLAVILATIWRNGTHFEANPKRPPFFSSGAGSTARSGDRSTNQ